MISSIVSPFIHIVTSKSVVIEFLFPEKITKLLNNAVHKKELTCFRESDRMTSDINHTVGDQHSRDTSNSFRSLSILVETNTSNDCVTCIKKVNSTSCGIRNLRTRRKKISPHYHSELKISFNLVSY